MSALTQELSFRGVELGSPVEDFMKALEGDGLEYVDTDSHGNVFYSGDFLFSTDCLFILYSVDKVTVSNIAIVLPREENLKEAMVRIRNIYSSKYTESAYTEEYGGIYANMGELSNDMFNQALEDGLLKYLIEYKEGIIVALTPQMGIIITYPHSSFADSYTSSHHDEI